MAKPKKIEEQTPSAVPEEVRAVLPEPEPEPVPELEVKPLPEPSGVPDTLTVALNDPHGVSFDTPWGRVTFNGNATALSGSESGGALPLGAYGLTHGVRRDVWDHVRKTYGKMAVFKSGKLFVSPSAARAESEAREREDVRHGWEAADPEAE
ncbi:MAG: hypothetical protein LBR80_03655 [Deltaproteobacteria bacterium]|jgi:hypothetical protein|nr:hypothetical protein [Deltaproteobacteria bacterium]